MNIYNRDQIQKLYYFSITPKGNISYSKADCIFSFYKNLLNDGDSETMEGMNRQIFWRYEKDLIAIGITKAQLQNLKSYKRHNIIPLMKLVEIDFSCQRPDWYVEPTLEKWGIAT